MKENGIKNLLIDLGGVLVNLNRERCVEQFRRLGFERIEELLDVSQPDSLIMRLETGRISPAHCRDELRRAASRPVSDADLDAAWNSFLADLPTAKLELLLRLRHHYAVYLLSNTNEIHWQWTCRELFPYKGFGVADYFQKAYLSYELGLAKPDPAIFRAVLEDARLRPEETLFLDDSAANCAAARTLGIATYTATPGEDWSHLFPSLPSK